MGVVPIPVGFQDSLQESDHDLDPNCIQLSSTDASVPTRHALCPAVGEGTVMEISTMKSVTFVPLLQDCIVAAAVLENWIEYGP